jgi:hypothetical protein
LWGPKNGLQQQRKKRQRDQERIGEELEKKKYNTKRTQRLRKIRDKEENK